MREKCCKNWVKKTEAQKGKEGSPNKARYRGNLKSGRKSALLAHFKLSLCSSDQCVATRFHTAVGAVLGGAA